MGDEAGNADGSHAKLLPFHFKSSAEAANVSEGNHTIRAMDQESYWAAWYSSDYMKMSEGGQLIGKVPGTPGCVPLRSIRIGRKG